jgi:hypothetical protein
MIFFLYFCRCKVNTKDALTTNKKSSNIILLQQNATKLQQNATKLFFAKRNQSAEIQHFIF